MKAQNTLTPQFKSNLPARHRIAKILQFVFQSATAIGIVMLVLLLLTVLNNLVGIVAIVNTIEPETFAINGIPLEDLPKNEIIQIIETNLSKGMIRQLTREKALEDINQQELYNIVQEKVIKPQIEGTWSLYDSLFKRQEIQDEVMQKFPLANLEWKSWFSLRFILASASSDPLQAGVRTALLGSLWTILITLLVAFPLGVGAAIYLEEYASDTWFNRVIMINISNLAGVPSIIYGMLGLLLFVRVLQPLTSGAIFGVNDPATANGRTILSAGLTLALLVLPLIIINAQEAIHSVPESIRQASLGLGATQWQTIWHHVLPSALPGILTGAILAISRALGETAPLVVIGGATFINFDPTGLFSKFTILPIQIYQWTARPQAEFKNLAAAAIVLLLIVLLSLNTVAIVLRNRFRSKI